MSKPRPKYKDVVQVKLVEVIMVERGVGAGEELSPYRRITEFYEPETGELLARTDDWADFNSMRAEEVLE